MRWLRDALPVDRSSAEQDHRDFMGIKVSFTYSADRRIPFMFALASGWFDSGDFFDHTEVTQRRNYGQRVECKSRNEILFKLTQWRKSYPHKLLLWCYSSSFQTLLPIFIMKIFLCGNIRNFQLTHKRIITDKYFDIDFKLPLKINYSNIWVVCLLDCLVAISSRITLRLVSLAGSVSPAWLSTHGDVT